MTSASASPYQRPVRGKREVVAESMLFVCNGSPKSGTTWIVQFFDVLWDHFEPTPAVYNKKNVTNPIMQDSVLSRIRGYDFYKEAHYYTKVHVRGEDWALNLLDMPDIRVLSIIRDVRDQFVSRFYHDKRNGEIDGDVSFDSYFAAYAERRVRQTLRYNAFWYGQEGRGPITTSYEFLKADPTTALLRFREALGLPDPGIFDVDRVQKLTDFSALPNTGPGYFARKGIVGDHRNHMSSTQDEQFLAILTAAGYGAMKRRVAMLYPYLEPYLERTDVGLD